MKTQVKNMSKTNTRMLLRCAVFAALTAVGAFIRIPFALSSITLQFFFTAMAGLVLLEEFRSVMVDRFVLTLINKRIMKPEYFLTKENGAVIMTEEGRKAFLSAWQGKKQEMITHPFLGEKIEWGMVPYAQSMLLARFLRGDLDEYPPFLWK